MHFQNPNYLFGLFFVIFPILIHLVNFRKYKKVYFSNTRFLKSIFFETKKQSQLKQLLVLAARILAIIFIVLAFSKPLFDNVTKKTVYKDKNLIYIYLDNSFSMQNQGESGILLDEAKKRVIQLMESYPASTQYVLITNLCSDFQRKPISKTDCLHAIEDVEISSALFSIDDFLLEQKNHNSTSNKSVFIFSDFQKGIFSKESLEGDSISNIYLVPIKSHEIDNIYFDSIWVNSPIHIENQMIEIEFVVVNKSNNSYEKVPIELIINGKQKLVSTIELKPQSRIHQKLSFKADSTGFFQSSLSLSDYPISFDNKLYFSFIVHKQWPILEIHSKETSSYIQTYFHSDSTFALKRQDENAISIAEIEKFTSICLNEPRSYSNGLSQSLINFVKNGGSLLLIPNLNFPKVFNNYLQDFEFPLVSENIDTNSKSISLFDIENPIYKEVVELSKGNHKLPENTNFPNVKKRFNFASIKTSEIKAIISTENNEGFLLQRRVGLGNIFALNTSLQSTSCNLASHSLFVPMMFNIAKTGVRNPQLYYNLSTDEIVDINATYLKNDEKLVINGTNNKEIIPEIIQNPSRTSLRFNRQIRESGNYILSKSGNYLLPLSFNYSKLESNFELYNDNDLSRIINESTNKKIHLISSDIPNLQKWIEQENSGIALWKIFIGLALLFLLIEVLLLRFIL